MSTVGIDFGTSNSVVATWTPQGAEVLSIDSPQNQWERYGFDRIMPSVFAEGSDGQARFGWEAKRSAGGRFEAVKRLFTTRQESMADASGSVFAVEEVSTMLFGHLKQRTADQGVDANQAVITVPANSRGLARHRTKICAGMAGYQVLALINEPTAAAMAYAAKSPGDQQLLVFDWGGGTLDVTILESVDGVFLEEASKGLPTKGGMDFDTRLRKLVLETVPDASAWEPADRRRFELDIELAKVQLSTSDYTVIQLPGGDSRRITRGMFEEAVAPLIEEARRPIEQCLRDLGAGRGSIDSVVMVGGTSKIPAVRRFVADLLEREPAVDVDPMTAVGEGAAIAAAVLSGELETNDFFVATEHALGTLTLNQTSDRLEFTTLIPRNHKLPASKTDTFSPLSIEQTGARLRVVEGDPDVPVDHPDNVVLKELEVEWGAGHPNRTIDLTYRYDVDGILHVTVVDNVNGAVLLEDDVSYGVTADKRKLVDIARRSKQTVEDGTVRAASNPAAGPADADAVRMMQQAEVNVIPFLADDEAAPIREAVAALREAATDELAGAKARLREALAPYSYLL